MTKTGKVQTRSDEPARERSLKRRGVFPAAWAVASTGPGVPIFEARARRLA
jgi:hypothetical protein